MRIVLLIMLYLSNAIAALVLTDAAKSYADFTMFYRYDQTSSLNINDIADSNFTHAIPSQFTFGYREGTVWFKLTITNKSKENDFVLYFTEPFWTVVDLYEPIQSEWIRHKNGLRTPLQERQIQDAKPAFYLHLHSAETKTYYIEGKTLNAQIGAFKLYTQKEFFRPSRPTLNHLYLFYSGILAIIIILNVFLWLEIRERIYAYYIGYVSAFIIFITMFNGSYLCFGFHPWERGLHVVGTVVMAFMGLFSGSFLELKKYYPTMNSVFKILITTFLVLGLLIELGTPYATLIFNILSSILVTLLLILAIRAWMHRKIEMRYYLVALIIYMPTMGMMVLTFNGLLENTDFTRYSFLFGALIEIIFFSLILASRFHAAKNEKIHFQKALLAEKKKNLERLEHEVTLQQEEIQEKNAILLHQSRYAAMGEMISMIAHQWRQPLNTLALINQDLYIRYKLDKCDPESFERTHTQINENLQYMSKTIDDFRNYYKYDTQKNPENLREVVELALRLSDVFLKYAKIKTEVIVATELIVDIPKNEMIQVLMNLIKNAHDAIVERRIPFGKITITIEESEGHIYIRTCDNGGGIHDTIGTKIFEPYFSTKSENGTGLGLYMSKSIIEEHCKGMLTFYNIQSGTCFAIMLPPNKETQS